LALFGPSFTRKNGAKKGYFKPTSQKTPNAIDKRRLNVILTEKGQVLNEEVIEVPLGVASKLPITLEMYTMLVTELDLLSTMLKNASIITKENA